MPSTSSPEPSARVSRTPLADSTTSGSRRPGIGPYGCQTCRRSRSSSSGRLRSGIGREIRPGTPAADGDEVGTGLAGLRGHDTGLRGRTGTGFGSDTADTAALVRPARAAAVGPAPGALVRPATARGAGLGPVLRQGHL